MAKLTLSDLVNLQNETSAVETINNNSDAIVAALENTLSRDGTTPNEMEANLDMNSYRILNLPAPIYNSEALRKQDLVDFLNGGDVIDAPQAREILLDNVTYYVRTDGSDSNTGLSDSAGAAFLTWQKAVNVIQDTLDTNGFTVTVQHGTESGTKTFTSGIVVTGFVGGGTVRFRGNGSTTVISTTGLCAHVSNGGVGTVNFGNMKLTSSTSSCIKIDYNSLVAIEAGLIFGDATSGYHLWVHDGKSIAQILSVAYTIDGDAAAHIFCQNGGHVYVESCTVTLTGTPAFSSAFFLAYPRGSLQWISNTLVGTATGKRYSISYLSLLNLNGADETTLPGSAQGHIDSSSEALVLDTIVNVQSPVMYGAEAGSTSAAAANVIAIQTAATAAAGGTLFIPEGTWYINALLTLKSNTVVEMAPGAVIKCYVAGWTGDNYIFRNENHAASSLTDVNIHLTGRGLLDATGMPADTHMWYMRMVTNSSFMYASGTGGGNVTAFLACKGTYTAFAKALDVGNCGFDHWDGPEDAVVLACEVDGSPAQGIQATACSTALGERHGKNIRFMFNTVRNVTNGAVAASAIIFNTAMNTATMSECLSMGNTIEDCDLGVVFQGLGEGRKSVNDRLVRVTGLPIFVSSTNGTPTDCQILDPELIDCDHEAGNIALISIDGARIFVTGVKIRNPSGAAYDLVCRFVSGSSNKVEMKTGAAGASGYYTDAGTNEFVYLFPTKATTATLEARGVAYDKVGAIAYATNGRKAAEGAGVGTGVPVWWNGTNWLTFHDNSTLAD